MKGIFVLLIAFVVSHFCVPVVAQDNKGLLEKQSLADYFLIDKNKPSVYIKFEKSGAAEPLFNGESRERYWLKLFNNTKGSISFCSFKTAQQYGDIGVVYDVEEIRHFGEIRGAEPEIPQVKSKKNVKTELPKVKPEEIKIPQGYSTGDVCKIFYLQSGKSLIFSIPKEHLILESKTFYIDVKFNYEWENEATEAGSHPLHIVSFGFGALPTSERKDL